MGVERDRDSDPGHARWERFMRRLALLALLAGSTALMSLETASAQSMPDAQVREVMIKTTLSRFNDANLANNYTILHTLAARQFANKFSANYLSMAFAPFRNQEMDISDIVAYPPVEDPASYLDKDGNLHLKGYFETSPSYLVYELSFANDGNGIWRVAGINVNIAPPEELGLAPGD
jgi:hypothetical protein